MADGAFLDNALGDGAAGAERRPAIGVMKEGQRGAQVSFNPTPEVERDVGVAARWASSVGTAQ